jgi:hypothetical protein
MMYFIVSFSSEFFAAIIDQAAGYMKKTDNGDFLMIGLFKYDAPKGC